MTLATCLVCGTRTDPGNACKSCGTPVPADARAVADDSGQREYWESIQDRLTRATAPRYNVTGLIGYGGMAGVFVADEPRLARRVAMKVLSPALMVDARLVERFMQEARTIAQLSHPNIVAIHEVDERDGLHWFTMTYVPGQTLGQVMGETAVPIPVPVVRAWLHQIGGALAFAHAHGIFHRDIKPGNVLLDLLGNAMVTDFGIAKLADVDHGLTRTGLLIGTPTYMSPEQCSGDPVTAASDQYSLGAMLYQLLTGMAPFTGRTLAVLQAHISEPPRPIRDLRPDCPHGLALSVQRMLAKRPEDRWPSLAAVLTAAGAIPPGFDDPVRHQMGQLAARAARLSVEPRPARLREGSREGLRITVEDASGRLLNDRRTEWLSSQPAVAIVGEGTLLGLSPGTTELRATSGSASLSFEVAVDADPVGAVQIRPASVVVHAGEQVWLDAGVADVDGSRLDGRVMLWSTSDPAVARVSAAGVVTGVAPGDATITARSGGKYAASTLTVMPARAVSPDTTAGPIRATVLSAGVASSQRRSGRRAPRAERAWRRRAGAIAGAAARARRAMPALMMATRRRAMPVLMAIRRAMPALMMATRRRATPALVATRRRAAVIASAAIGAIRHAMLALTRRRRLTAAIAGAAMVVALVVTAVIVLPRMRTQEVGGQAGTASSEPAPIEPAPSAEPRLNAPTGGAEPTTGELESPPSDSSRAPADTGPVPPAPVGNGRILVTGDLPAGATVVISDATGRTWPLTTEPIALAPGRYTVDFHAPGYETERDNIVLGSGQTERWTPNLRPVRPAEPAPASPTRNAEAARAAVVEALVGAIRPFVDAFDRRDANVVLPVLPQSEHERWRSVLESDEVTEFSATLLPTTSLLIEGSRASISFSVTVSYRTDDERQGAYLTFFGFAERGGDGWELYELEYVSTQDFR